MNSNRFTPVALIAASLLAATAGTASATTISSFTTGATFNGITVSAAPQGSSLDYTVSLNAGATFTLNGNNYNITDIIGFYLLAPGLNDGAQAALSSAGAFSNDSDHRGAGSIYGWKSNPNSGITIGHSQMFAYPSIPPAAYTQIGFHVRIDGLFPGTNGNTGNITGSIVPTPGAAAALGVAGLASGRRRRRP
jgi:hypothetical protein